MRRDTGLSTHILPTSANLVGACMCALPLVKMLHRHGLADLMDEGLALASLLFLSSAGLSYASMRQAEQGVRLESLAERLFLVGLVLVFLSLVILAFSMD